MSCTSEKEVKRLECENQKLDIKLQEHEDWIDLKMKNEKFLYSQMVAKYHSMMVNYKACEEQLKQINAENARFKDIAQCLTDKMQKSTSRDITSVDRHSINYSNDDLFNPIMILEVSPPPQYFLKKCSY